ncbi:MAG: type II secretion system protein [Parcubacteria group bacterium]
MMKINFKKKEGFTLMEVLAYISVLVVIISCVISLLFWAVGSASKSKALREVSDNSRRAFEVMDYEIRAARSVYTPTTNSTQLSLETTEYLPEGEKSSYLDFYVSDDVLYMKKESHDPIPLTSDNVEIKKIFFSQISTTSTVPSIQVGLEISYKNPSNRPEYSAAIQATSTFSFRNY